jgi:pimeloyl-ACP methyl ester carboxylesterase
MSPMHDRLAGIRAPTLVVCGALDPVRARAEFVASRIPGARLVVIGGAGHAPHLESPARFRVAVLPFISAPALPAISVPEEVA